CQLIGGAVEQSGFGGQAEGVLLVLAGYQARFPVEGLGGYAAATQALAFVAVTEGDQLLTVQPQAAFLGESGDEHARMGGQGSGAVLIGLQAVGGFAVDRDTFPVRRIAGGEGDQFLRADQGAAEGQYRGGQPAAGAEQERTAVNHASDLAYLFRIDPA